MYKLLIMSILALALAACAPTPSAVPTPQSCAHTIDLPHATVQVEEHQATTSLKPDVSSVSVSWQAGALRGGDNVNAPEADVIALGCADGLTIQETGFRAK